ncbi:hypothetical protein GALMADRAFT_248274 [Galerina marginata CBS 339.88]|uniref:DNA-directed DNA polymerase n=1 Tax=Galerina marginata (strain CBS 339.88) TaxID=685588 RepID=A0A067T9I7_GALM3|nr:hypothetical protein GALMADRAFT_248274 [Galerina marginata CBS 339.88]
MKRSSLSTSTSSESDSDSGTTRPSKRLRSSSPTGSTDESKNSPLKVYIVQAKLDEKVIRELFDMVEAASRRDHRHKASSAGGGVDLELCSSVMDTDVIVTNVRMKKRFERHVDWNIAKQKAIVTPDWLRESVKQDKCVECGNYAALSELHDETVQNCPEEKSTQDTDDSLTSLADESFSSPPRRSTPVFQPTNPRVYNNWTLRYACQRASPLVCVNQALAEELGVLGRSRELEGLAINALSYERSVAIIKSYPHLITKETYSRDIVKLPGLGNKTLSKIKEFIKNGCIEESRTTRKSERFQSLSTFATIYGIGATNARQLYDLGLRTIEDMERYYDVIPGSTASSLGAELVTPNGRKIPTDKAPDMSIKISLVMREDLEVPIPREEVEEMHKVVMRELEKIQPGCVSTVVGGYRRGKPLSNDVDIVISHSDLRSGAGLVKGLCAKFIQLLHASGLVTNVMHLSGFHAHNALRTGHWDSLEKALTVFVLPSDGKRKPLHRRLDLIFASPEAYWTAVVGWSGSKMFQRDLRLWAKTERGLKFDSSGLTRRHDSKLLIPRSEREVFDILGLDWVDPTMRNADV